MPKLSKEFIEREAQAPDVGQVIYRDDDLPGFAVRVTPKGKSYIVEKRVNGVNRRITIGKCTVVPIETARKEAIKVLADMARGIDPKTGRSGGKHKVTLREVADKYLAVRRLRPASLREYKKFLRNYLADWLDLPIASITKDMIQERHKKVSSGTTKGTSGNATANGTMKFLSSLFNFANEHFGDDDEPLVKVNPVLRLSRDRQWHAIPPRRGVVPDEKLADWYRAVRALENTTAQDYFLLLILTGFRRTEALLLSWQDIDFGRRIISLPAHTTKTNQPHVMPMSEFLFDLMRARYEADHSSPHVFPGRNQGSRLTDFRHSLLSVREKSDFQFNLHDLRRTFITMAEKLDLPHNVLKRLANHNSNVDITSNYVVIDFERLRAHVNKINNEFVRLMGADIDDLVLWRRSHQKPVDHDQLRLPITLRPRED